MNKTANKKEYHRAWCAANPEKCASYTKKYVAKNRAAVRERRKRWRLKNQEKVRKYHREYAKAKRDRDVSFRLGVNIRNRVIWVIRHGSGVKSLKTEALIGCKFPFLFQYLESKFKPGMSWENYGKFWEVDHIIPCAAYDLTDLDQQLACFHYSNLQPLSVFDNRSKHDTIPAGFKFVKPASLVA